MPNPVGTSEALHIAQDAFGGIEETCCLSDLVLYGQVDEVVVELVDNERDIPEFCHQELLLEFNCEV